MLHAFALAVRDPAKPKRQPPHLLPATHSWAAAPCAGLARVAARRLQPGPASDRLYADVAVADAMRLPYRRGCCDGVLCIAVLHHISSVQRRLRLLGELLALLRPGE